MRYADIEISATDRSFSLFDSYHFNVYPLFETENSPPGSDRLFSIFILFLKRRRKLLQTCIAHEIGVRFGRSVFPICNGQHDQRGSQVHISCDEHAIFLASRLLQ